MIDLKKEKFDYLLFVMGCFFLGIYFLLPGIFKIFNYSDNLILIESKGVPISALALPIVILIEVILGIFLIFRKYLKVSSIVLFILTMLINIFIHDFWNLSGDIQAHEAQNFYKNIGVAAGLLVLASTKRANY